MGHTYLAAKQHDNALKSYKDSLSELKVIYGKNFNTKTVDVLNSIANFYDLLKDYDLAIKYYKKSVNFLAAKQREEYLYMRATLLHNIGSLYLGKKNYEGAVSYYQKAFCIMVSFDKPPDHIKTVIESITKVGILIAEKYSFDCASTLRVLDICLHNNLNLNLVNLQMLAETLYNARQIKDTITAYKMAMLYTSQSTNAQKKSINHNLGCMYNVLASSTNINDKDVDRNSYLVLAQEAFEEAIKHSKFTKNNAGLYTEYAKFLIDQDRYKEAYDFLKLAVESADLESGLNYGIVEKDTIAQLLKQQIEESPEQSIKIKAICYAYYLLLLYYEKFNDSGIRDMKAKSCYMESFNKYVLNSESLNDVSYLLLADTKSNIQCWKIDELIYDHHILRSKLGRELLSAASKKGLANLLLDAGKNPEIASILLNVAQKYGTESSVGILEACLVSNKCQSSIRYHKHEHYPGGHYSFPQISNTAIVAYGTKEAIENLNSIKYVTKEIIAPLLPQSVIGYCNDCTMAIPQLIASLSCV